MILRVEREHFALALVRADSLLGVLPTGSHWLSASEQARLTGMNHGGRREEFLLGRWLLRSLYAARFGGTPEQWPLREQPQLPPVPERDTPFVFVSISHGGGFIAAAAGTQAIGVDVESSRRDLPAEIFEPLFRHLPETAAARLDHWVATEAFLKQQTLPAHTDTIRRHALRPAEATGRVRMQRSDHHVFAVAAVPKVLEDPAFAGWSWWD